MSWQELRKPWHDTSVDYCDVCGNLLIHNYWEFDSEGEILRACRQDDESLWARLQSFRETYPSIVAKSLSTRQSTDAGLPAIKE